MMGFSIRFPCSKILLAPVGFFGCYTTFFENNIILLYRCAQQLNRMLRAQVKTLRAAKTKKKSFFQEPFKWSCLWIHKRFTSKLTLHISSYPFTNLQMIAFTLINYISSLFIFVWTILHYLFFINFFEVSTTVISHEVNKQVFW